MNNYTIDLFYTSSEPASLSAQLLALSHFVRNGQNLNFIRAHNTKYLAINADFNYSLSNVQGTYAQIYQNIYSSRHTNTIETEDRPFPRVGNLVLVAVEKGTTEHLKDIGEYTKFPLNDDEDDMIDIEVYVGYVNSSKTDFYTPLSSSNVKHAVYFDNPQKQQNLNFAARKSA